jgi:hypothetical protein
MRHPNARFRAADREDRVALLDARSDGADSSIRRGGCYDVTVSQRPIR